MLDYAANYGLSLSNCVILDQTDARLLNFVNFICQRVWTLCVLVFIAYLVEQKGDKWLCCSCVVPILISGYNYTIWSRWSLVVSSSGQAEEDDVTLASVRSDQVSVVGGLTCLFLFLNHVSITIILMIIIFPLLSSHLQTQSNKLKSLKVAKWRKDEWRMWMMKDDDFKMLMGFADKQTDGRTNRHLWL